VLDKDQSSCPAFIGTQPKDRPHAYKDCGENYYKNSDRETLMATDSATTTWYAGLIDWNF